MSALQWNKASSLVSVRPRSFSNSGVLNLQKGTASQTSIKYKSGSYAPLSASGRSECQEAHSHKRILSFPLAYARRKQEAIERGQAHGNCSNFRQNNFLIYPPSSTPGEHPTSSVAFLETPFDLDFELILAILSLSKIPPSPSTPLMRSMSKTPQNSVFARSSPPKALPMPSPGFYAPKAKTPLSPQIFFSSSTDSESEDRMLISAHDPTVTAVLDPHRRSPPPESRPVLRNARTTEDEYVLSVHLPGYSPEMVTVTSRKDNSLAVVADLWHAEADSHLEWLVFFPAKDAYLLQTRARFEGDGTLMIHVPRRNLNFYRYYGRLR